MVGKIRDFNILVSGLEASTTIDFNGLGEICIGVLLDYEHEPLRQNNDIEIYVEDNPSLKIKIGSIIDAELKVIYGNKLHKITEKSVGYFQDIVNSPHAIFHGEVKKNIENNILECYINENLNNIEVEFEEILEGVNIGDIISFSGEFSFKSLNIIA